MARATTLGMALLLFAALPATADIIVDLYGGGDYLTLAEGMSAAAPGVTVLVAPGLYSGVLNRDLSFGGKDIIVKAMPGDDPVIVDAEHYGRCFIFENGETSAARLEGIVMRRGAGGIHCSGPVSPTIIDCEIVECSASRGAGLNCVAGAAPTLIGCTFRENVASYAGGGIRCSDGSSLDLEGCFFKGNQGDLGGGVMLRAGSTATVDGTLFEGNIADYSAGFRCENSTVTITNSVFSRNIAYSGGGLGSGSSGLVTLRYCVFYDNTASFRGAGYACGTPADVQYCTFVGGSSPTGSGIFCGPPQGDMIMTNSIVAFGDGPAMTCDEGGAPTVARCCFYGNTGGIGPCGTYSDIIYENPYFCAMPLEDLTVNEVSACLPPNNPWGEQLGAFGAGCSGAVAVESASWATIKAMYR